MHECLLLEDVLYSVFEQIRLDTVVRGKYRTLLALATTCRAFCEPALDQLYHTLSSIHPIIRCLPQDVWHIRRTPGQMSVTLSITKPLEQHHWDTIAKYSRRVRWLRFSFSSEELEAYIALARPPDSSYLFPNLCILKWTCDTSDPTQVQRIMPLLKFTLRPSLYMITLRLSHIALRTHVDLHTLGTHCPNLRVLDMMQTEASPFTDQLVSSCRHLRSLHTVHVSEVLMQSISTLSSLQSLGLILDDIAPDSIQLWRWHCNSHTFPSLQDLSLRTCSVQTVASFLKLKSWLLRRVMITLEILTFDAGTREQLFWVLHDQCDRHLLEKIVISAEKSDTEDRPVADYQTFIPLMAFRNLTHLTLYSVMSLAIDDDALERLALAWPRLQHFRIVQQLGSYIWPNITLLGLALLLKHCPDLSDLAISVDAQAIPDTDHLPLPCNTHIETIDVNYSPIMHPEQVAAFLSRMMPRLETVFSWSLFRTPLQISSAEWRRMWNIVSERVGGSAKEWQASENVEVVPS